MSQPMRSMAQRRTSTFGSRRIRSMEGSVRTQPGTGVPCRACSPDPSAKLIARPSGQCSRSSPCLAPGSGSVRTAVGRSAMTHRSSPGHHQPVARARAAHRPSW